MSNLISIIIPFYKKNFFFSETIKSILIQSYKNFEIILIYDDSSRKDLIFVKKILKKIKKKKIIINKKNLGVGASRNIGVKSAKGNFIAFLDADDIWHKDKLKKQLNFMRKNKINFSYTDYLIINESGKIIRKIKAPKKIKYNDLLYSCDIGLSSVMVSSKLLKLESFPNIKTKEDYILWLKLSKKRIKMLGINEPLTYWRKTSGSLSSSITQKLKDAFIVYNKYLKFNILKSLILTSILSLNFIKKRYL
jgi:teichuronic acid biosynthesis glycosyltransferase TuaG